MLDIDRHYGSNRFHVTVLPLGEGRDISPARLDRLIRVAESLRAEPFRIAFDTLSRNALVGKHSGAVRAFRKLVARSVAASCLPVPHYDSRPHLSVAYGPAPDRNVAIQPVAWLATDFVLIRSIRGEGRHEELGRWPLLARQRSFAF